jgi:hypothetical protein
MVDNGIDVGLGDAGARNPVLESVLSDSQSVLRSGELPLKPLSPWLHERVASVAGRR